MKPRIQITDDMMFPIAQGYPTHWTLSITIPDNTREQAEALKAQILQNEVKASQRDKINAYVYLLQTGDPETENPKKILDYIDEILGEEK